MNLSEESIRGPPHNPGSGGWPTVRYFNKETGLDGGSYVKITSNAMCEELGNEDNMRAYVEDYGNTSLCRIELQDQCSDKELAYIEKFKDKSIEDVQVQLDRLAKMTEGKMKPELMAWAAKRIKILRQLIVPAPENEL